MIRALLALAAAGGLLVGCTATMTAPTPASAEPARRVTFLCDRDQSIVVTFQGNGATIDNGGDKAQLAGQPVASGIHYVGDGHDLRGKGSEVVWTDPSGTARACRDQAWAMSQPQIDEPRAELAGTSWRLVHFQSSDDAIGKLVPPRVERYTLAFAADGRLAMGLDCNRGSARWQATPSSTRGGTLAISAGPMTRAMCGPGAIDVRLAQDMAKVRSFTLADGRLNLALEADAGIYVWDRVSDDGD